MSVIEWTDGMKFVDQLIKNKMIELASTTRKNMSTKKWCELLDKHNIPFLAWRFDR